MYCIALLMLEQQWWVIVTETIWLTKPKKLTIGPLYKKGSKPVDLLTLTSGSGFKHKHLCFNKVSRKGCYLWMFEKFTWNSICARLRGGSRHEWRKDRFKTVAQYSGSKEILHDSFLLTFWVLCSLQLSDLASYFLILILVQFHLVLGILYLDRHYLFLAPLFGTTLATNIVYDIYLFLLHCWLQTSFWFWSIPIPIWVQAKQQQQTLFSAEWFISQEVSNS